MTLKNIIVPVLFMGVATFAQTKKEVTLKPVYKPETTYRQTALQKHSNTIRYKGDPDVLQVLKEQGVQNPTEQVTNIDFITETKTGKSLDGTQIPLTLTVVKLPEAFSKKGFTQGVKAYGIADADGHARLDSVTAPEVDKKLKANLLDILETAMKPAKFPDKPFKLGQTQQITTTASIPLPGHTVEMDVVSAYTLTEIKKGIALFDIVITYKLKQPDPNFRIIAEGNGKGTMSYDVKNNFPLQQQSTTITHIDFSYKQFDIEMNANLHYENTATVTPDAK